MANSIRDTIESIQAVKACRLVEENGDISQVFVEAELESTDDNARTQEIKAIVRSIVGAVAIKHNVELDYRKIKVIDYKPSEEFDKAVHPRIQIVAAYHRRLPQKESVVELRCMNKDYVGRAAASPDLAVNTFHAFANAFAQMGFGSTRLEYLQVINHGFGQNRIILLKVHYTHPSGEVDKLLGVAEVDEDLPTAVVKAALNAVNRRIVITP